MKSTILLSLLLAANVSAVSDKRDISILGADEKNPKTGRILMPHVPPVIWVRQTKGAAMPEKGSVGCHWQEVIREARALIVGTCDDGVELVITGIDLNY